MKISKKSAYFGISAFQNFKIIGLFRCHRGSPKKVEQKSICYVFVQAKDVSGQKSQIIDFFVIFGPADLLARVRCHPYRNIRSNIYYIYVLIFLVYVNFSISDFEFRGVQ